VCRATLHSTCLVCVCDMVFGMRPVCRHPAVSNHVASLVTAHAALEHAVMRDAVSCTVAGDVAEIGQGPGEGTTLNIPLPPGSGRGAYRAVFDRVVGPALDMFGPQLVLVSAGG
jgi:hypothetical protein